MGRMKLSPSSSSHLELTRPPPFVGKQHDVVIHVFRPSPAGLPFPNNRSGLGSKKFVLNPNCIVCLFVQL